MAEILGFPKRISQGEERVKDAEPIILIEETTRTIKRVIHAITSNKSEEESAVIDIEALKDIFSMFSVKESRMIEQLSLAEEIGKINRDDKILLFAIFMIFKGSNFERIIDSVLLGSATEEMLENMPGEIKSYLAGLS